MTTSEAGSRSSAIAVVLVRYGTASMPGTEGVAGLAPAAITTLGTASGAPSTVSVPSGPKRAAPSR